MKLNKQEIQALLVPLLSGKPANLAQIRELNKEADYLEQELKKLENKDNKEVLEINVSDLTKKEFRNFDQWNRQAGKILLELDKKLG